MYVRMWNYTARPKVLSSKCLTDKNLKSTYKTKFSLNQLNVTVEIRSTYDS